MGAWGTTVLENDGALDAMITLGNLRNPRQAIEEYLASEYVEEQLLAVEIIDISIHGVDESILGSFYGYQEWFEELTKNPMNDLQEEAIRTLDDIKKRDNNWFPAFVKERKKILDKIEKRLKGSLTESDGGAK